MQKMCLIHNTNSLEFDYSKNPHPVCFNFEERNVFITDKKIPEPHIEKSIQILCTCNDNQYDAIMPNLKHLHTPPTDISNPQNTSVSSNILECCTCKRATCNKDPLFRDITDAFLNIDCSDYNYSYNTKHILKIKIAPWATVELPIANVTNYGQSIIGVSSTNRKKPEYFHPIRTMGKFIKFVENRIRSKKSLRNLHITYVNSYIVIKQDHNNNPILYIYKNNESSYILEFQKPVIILLHDLKLAIQAYQSTLATHNKPDMKNFIRDSNSLIHKPSNVSKVFPFAQLFINLGKCSPRLEKTIFNCLYPYMCKGVINIVFEYINDGMLVAGPLHNSPMRYLLCDPLFDYNIFNTISEFMF
jgi:hypothetical protein